MRRPWTEWGSGFTGWGVHVEVKGYCTSCPECQLVRVHVVQHHIASELGRKVQENPHSVLQKMWEMVCQELQAMLEIRVAEESKSEWWSPIMLVPKPDRLPRFCIDFRKVDAISKFDAYLMPWVDELLNRLGLPSIF